MDIVVSLYIFCVAMAETMGGKTVPLFKVFDFQLNASVALLVFPLIFTLNDIVAEVYGKARARSIARSSLFVVAGIMLFALLATSLPPSTRFAESESAYDMVFKTSARISAASLTAFALAEIIDIAIFARLRKKLGDSALWLRNNVSNFVAQFFDTLIFMTLAFYAFDKSPTTNAVFLIGLILPYWLLKCAISVIETPFVYAGVRWLREEN